jgi:hypothetical protein
MNRRSRISSGAGALARLDSAAALVGELLVEAWIDLRDFHFFHSLCAGPAAALCLACS